MTSTPPEDGAAIVITKRRVTFRSANLLPDGSTAVQEVVDYVRPDFLDAYLAANRGNWQFVEVSDEPDAGPGGYHGATTVPANLNHPLAGQTFAETYPDGDAVNDPTSAAAQNAAAEGQNNQGA